MAARFAPIVAALCAAGCATPPPVERVRTVEVVVEVPAECRPPAWLVEAYRPESLPVFISPNSQGASVALDSEGVAELQAVLRSLVERDRAWRDWSDDLSGE